MYQFQDHDIPQLLITSFQSAKNQQPKQTQTLDSNTQDQETSTQKTTRTIKFQVSPDMIQATNKQPTEAPKYNEQQLWSFLGRVEHLVISELNESEQCQLYWQYDLKATQTQQNQELYSLEPQKLRSFLIEQQYQILDLQWNCNGLIIAATYGKYNSNQKGIIAAWNIVKRDFNPTNPHYIIEFSNPIKTLAFHPSKPNILAGGSIEGQIVVWDLLGDKQEIFISETDEYMHRETVSKVQWIDAKLNNLNSVLASLSTDGKFLIWNMNTDADKISKFPLKGFYLLRKKENQIEPVGATSFSQLLEDRQSFIFGSEGGSVLKGLIQLMPPQDSTIKLLETSSVKLSSECLQFLSNCNVKFIPEIKSFMEEYCKRRGITIMEVNHIFAAKPDIRKLYINPIVFAYESHSGTVVQVTQADFFFVTASIDGQVRVYSPNNPKPMFTFDHSNTYIYDVGVSSTKKSAFACATQSGQVYLYDVLNKKYEQTTILPNDIMLNQSSFILNWNPYQPEQLAVAYQLNIIKIFKIATKFVEWAKGEEEKWQILLDSDQG